LRSLLTGKTNYRTKNQLCLEKLILRSKRRQASYNWKFLL
jgi:hypothetical protein